MALPKTGKVSYEKLGAITIIAIERGTWLSEARYLNATHATIDELIAARGLTRTTEWNLSTDGEAIYGEAHIEVAA
jgi:hypothetical protein